MDGMGFVVLCTDQFVYRKKSLDDLSSKISLLPYRCMCSDMSHISAISDQSTTTNLKKQNPGETVVVHLGFLHYQLRCSKTFLETNI